MNCEQIEREKSNAQRDKVIPETPEVASKREELAKPKPLPKSQSIPSPSPSNRHSQSAPTSAASTRESSLNRSSAAVQVPSKSVIPQKRVHEESAPVPETPEVLQDGVKKSRRAILGSNKPASKFVSTKSADSVASKSFKANNEEQLASLQRQVSRLLETQSKDTTEIERIVQRNLQLQRALDKAKEEGSAELEQAKREISKLKGRLRARRPELNTDSSDSETNPIDPYTYYPPKKPSPKPLRDPGYHRPDVSADLYEVAPYLLPENVFFDSEAKIREIEARPSRKATFGKLLANTRKGQGEYPHREIRRATPPPLNGFALRPKTSEEEQDVDGDVDMDGDKYVKEDITFEEFMDGPKNPIPVRIRDSLAYRDGSRVGLSLLAYISLHGRRPPF
jgi:hypothetical protein